jgi:hypothetical protein
MAMTRRVAVVVILAAMAIAPAVAFAQPRELPGDDADWGARPRVSASVGLFTPTGELGAEYTQPLAPGFEVGVGVGAGLSGAQFAAMPRLRFGRGYFAMTLGAGVSGGPLRVPGFCWGEGSCMDDKANALWINGEIGAQFTSRGGLAFRIFGGVGAVATHGECTSGDCRSIDDLWLPYLGVSLGHTF